MHLTFSRRPARLLLSTLCLALLAACGQQQPEQPEGPQSVPVVIEAAAVKPIADRIEAVGTTRASDSVEITARVSNVITDINFDEGALVDKGQVLVKLESSEARANLAEAEAALVEIRTQYERSQELIRSNAISRSLLTSRLHR